MKKFLLFASFAFLAGCAADVSSSTDPLRQFCGGIAGIACPSGYSCVDDPRDSCDPNRGGADCGGICRHTRCSYNDPSKTYVSRDPQECQVIRFVCAADQTYFSDGCGCGCQDTGSTCAYVALCIQGYVWDDASCSCVPAPGPACGSVNCASGEVCCNASCGICTPPGYFCTQQACSPI
jgi:hypothetical protein